MSITHKSPRFSSVSDTSVAPDTNREEGFVRMSRFFTSTTCAAEEVTYGALTRMPCHTGRTAHLARGAHLQQPGRDRHTKHLHSHMPAFSESASAQNRTPVRHFMMCGV